MERMIIERWQENYGLRLAWLIARIVAILLLGATSSTFIYGEF